MDKRQAKIVARMIAQSWVDKCLQNGALDDALDRRKIIDKADRKRVEDAIEEYAAGMVQ